MVGESTARVLAAGSTQRGKRTVVTALPIDQIEANPRQPRRHFDPQALRELAASIEKHGLLQPLVVCRDAASGRFIVMAGERRLRAARLAGLRAVPALVRDDDPIEVAMIENLQREDLSPLEEAEGLCSLVEQYGYTHEALADLIGKSRPYVSNTLALRKLPQQIRQEYHAQPDVSREILISVARAETPERQDFLWKMAKLRRLSVQRFRSAQSGNAGSRSDVDELARQTRRMGRRIKVLLAAALTREQAARAVQQLERIRRQAASAISVLEERAAGAAPDAAEG